MPQYDFSHAPPAVRLQIDMILNACQKWLVPNMIGVYLHGSLAMGAFNPCRSDIDLLVVNRHRLTSEQKMLLAGILLRISAHPAPLEISFLCQKDIIPWQYPTPYDFHYSETWRESLQTALNSHTIETSKLPLPVDDDLAAHITVLHQRGCCLWGAPIHSVFPIVPPVDLLDSLQKDFHWALERKDQLSMYLTLNICRTLAYLQDGKIRSKDEGGVWALNHLPKSFHPLITSALRAYRGKAMPSQWKGGSLLNEIIAYAQNIIGF